MNDYMKFRQKHIEAGRPLPEKKQYRIPKVSKKRQSKIDAEKLERGDEDSFLVRWYKSKMKISSGVCSECGHVVETKIYRYAINTICHILGKRDAVCPSVKYHPLNFIILCEHHHDQFDKSNWGEIEQWGCWPVIMERLIMVFPDLDPSERRFFPQSVLTYMEKHEPFTERE